LGPSSLSLVLQMFPEYISPWLRSTFDLSCGGGMCQGSIIIIVPLPLETDHISCQDQSASIYSLFLAAAAIRRRGKK
jgi:hypothetical protein